MVSQGQFSGMCSSFGVAGEQVRGDAHSECLLATTLTFPLGLTLFNAELT